MVLEQCGQKGPQLLADLFSARALKHLTQVSADIFALLLDEVGKLVELGRPPCEIIAEPKDPTSAVLARV